MEKQTERETQRCPSEQYVHNEEENPCYLDTKRVVGVWRGAVEQ